jgi:predicted nucleotidyltransferase
MNTFYDISGKLDPLISEAIREIHSVARAIGIPFFIVGATARDIIIEYCYGIAPVRRTLDVDLGVQIPAWEKMDELSAGLIGSSLNNQQKSQRVLKSVES